MTGRRVFAFATTALALVSLVAGLWCSWNGQGLVAIALYAGFFAMLALGADLRNRGPR